MGIAAVLYRPWGWHRAIPMSSGFDGVQQALFADLAVHGQLAGTDRLGAPFGLHMGDFAIGGDRISLWWFKLIGQVASDPITIVNIYFLLGFGLVAGATYLVARALRLGSVPSVAVALLFTFVPYHFAHDAQHSFLANYSGLALVVLLAVWVMRDELPIPFVRVPRAQWTAAHRTRLVAVVIIVLLGASTGSYYAGFAVILLVGAAALSQLHRRSWASLGAAGVVIAALGLVAVANTLPSIIWRESHGVNNQVAFRSVADNERYGLHLTQALLPGPEHRVAPLASLGERARNVDQPGEPGMYLGVVAVIGLAGSVLALLALGLRGRPETSDDDHRRSRWERTMRQARAVGVDPDGGPPLPLICGVLGLWVLAVATMGGLGFTLAVAGFTQFRAWDRFGLVLSLLGLLSMGWWATLALARTNEHRRLRGYAAVGLIVIVGLFDQIPGTVTPDYASARVHVDATRAFTAAMETALPSDAMVFQLPVATFPEAGPTGDMADYSLLLPYVVGNRSLRWSYGGMRGRAQDWQLAWANQPFDVMIKGVAAAGFDALYIDRRAYGDRGASLDAQLLPITGPPVATSADGTLSWYDLRPLHAALVRLHGEHAITEAGTHITSGVVPRFSGDIGNNEAVLTSQRRWIGSDGIVHLDNPLDVDRRITITLSLFAPKPATLHASGVGGNRTVHIDGDMTTNVTITATIRPRTIATLHLHVDGLTIPTKDLEFAAKARITQFLVSEPTVLDVLH